MVRSGTVCGGRCKCSKWIWSWQAVDAVLLFGVLAALLRFRQRAARRKRIVREERLRHFRMS